MQIALRFSSLLTSVIYTFFIILMASCHKDTSKPSVEIFNSDYTDIKLNSGFSNNLITINAQTWSINYIKDLISGEMLHDKSGRPINLDTAGSVEIESGWLKLEKTVKNNTLNMSLIENFSDSPRKFIIGVLANGKQEKMLFTQNRGEGYSIIDKEIVEVPGSRKEYLSKKNLHTIILANNSSIAQRMETTDIFKDVNYTSEFISHDYGAFEWMNSQDTLIFMDEIRRNTKVVWSERVFYRKGQSFEPYLKAGNKDELLVPPYTNIKVSGEMLYLERECLYTFTIKNLSSGNTFKITGIWKQIVPFLPITHISN